MLASRSVLHLRRLAFLACCIGLLGGGTASASHFRFGHITWIPRPAIAPNTIEFTFTTGVRRARFSGSALDGFPRLGDVIDHEDELCFGDGACPFVLYEVTAVDIADDLVVGLGLLPDAGSGTTVVESEPNDGSGQADPLTLSDDYSGTIATPGDVDVVSFPATAGTHVFARTTAGTLGDTTLRLLDTDGTTPLATNDDFEGGSSFTTSGVGRVLPADGTYYLEIAGAGPLTGTYGLELRTASPIRHTYASPGTYQAYLEGCCRLSDCDDPNAHVNNADEDYRLEATVDVGPGNSSPVSGLPPIVHCPESGTCSFAIPASDNEGDTIGYRLSRTDQDTTNESELDHHPGPPECPNAASIDPTTGLFTWNTAGCELASDVCGPDYNTLYSTQVAIEDPTSKVVLDFLIQLVDCPPGNATPAFDEVTGPACGSTIAAPPGGAVAFAVRATDANGADTVTLNSAGLPSGAAMTPALPVGGNPTTSAFAWTPAATQAGRHIVTFTVTDDCGAQALCAITLDVLEQCDNGVDDDGNDLVDCADPDCASAPACTVVPPTNEVCDNGVDDNGNDLVDCADPDCASAPACTVVPPTSEVCDNCVDDDGDGLVDVEDPACCGNAEPTTMTVQRAKFAPKRRGGGTGLLVKSAPAVDLGRPPTAQDITLVVRPEGSPGGAFCARFPADATKAKKNGIRFKDPKGTVASTEGISRLKLRVKRTGEVRVNARGARTTLVTPEAGPVRLTWAFRDPTAGAGEAQCSTAVGTFRAARKGSVRFP